MQSCKSYPWFLYPLILSTLCPFSSCSSISHPQLYYVKSSLSISPCHDHQLTLSSECTEYSIYSVQLYTEYTASTKNCHPSLGTHDDDLTPENTLSFGRTFLVDSLPQAKLYMITQRKCHLVKIPHYWVNLLMKRVLWTTSTGPINHLQVLLQSHSIMATKYISILT